MFLSLSSTDVATISCISLALGESKIDIGTVLCSFELLPSQSINLTTSLSLSQLLPNQSIDGSVCFANGNISFNCFTNLSECIALSAPVSAMSFAIELPHVELFFGKNATQTTNTLTIFKSDLTGLTPSAINTTQSLLVGIINRILDGKSSIQFMHIDFEYWGYGVNNGKRTDTVIIRLYNTLAIANGFEIASPLITVTPNDY